MSVIELLATLNAKDIQLSIKGDQLVVQGNKKALGDPAVLALLREHKPALIELIQAGHYSAVRAGQITVPANVISPDTTRITPPMLPLATLSQADIDRIVAAVPGGVANVQDIYPLAPLQEGILFHHVSAEQGDPYVMQSHFAFDNPERLHAFVQALQGVIDRHDILRTGVVWEGLQTPLQVVWRKAELPVQHIELDPADGDIAAQLHARFDARHYRLDVTQAPLLRVVHAGDDANQRIVAMLLFHHMALDHTALDVVRHEMQAFLLGHAGQLGQAVPFRNYVAQARLGISEQEHEAFFRDMLGDIDEPTLPFGLQDVQGDGSGIQEASLPIDPLLGQRLRAQARQLGVSAASLFHMGWGQVLGAVSGKEKVVFGTVLMGRMQGGGDNDRALGIFINTLPLRVDVDAQAVGAGVKATHARLTTLMRHEHAALALAQRCSGVAAPTPLFSALLNYRHSAGGVSAETLSAWDGIETLSSEERTNYPLTLSVDDLGDRFSLTLLATAQVDALRICSYLHTALENLVHALEATPQLAVNRVPILPAAERERLLTGFNDTAVDYPRGLTLHARFEAQAAFNPDALAAVYQGQRLTYGELNQRANPLAHHLRELGVQLDDRVAIVARRGLDALVALVAILKSGACYVPIDPSHPAERLSYLLSDSAPVAVLTQATVLERLPALDVPVLNLDKPVWQHHPITNPQVADLTPAHLAYVIYTSGSTGLPKGVMVEHQTVTNLVDWHCEAFDLRLGSHTSSLAGFGFDAMAWEVWPALCAGATLHLPPAHDGSEDIDALLDWWRAQPLDVSFLPTPVAEYAFSQNIQHLTLRTLLIGGDRLRQFSTPQSFNVINNYGPTEATVVATSGRIDAGQILHIGKPMANARVYLLDEQQQPVPIGVAGELYVGGCGVARGYLNRPDLTAERFLPDPFSAEPQARMYRTGDLARWLADGNIEYLGRNDDQVKIRGIRIELGEIENRLNSLPGIKEAVVLAREDEPGKPRLVAYFTENAPQDVGELRAHLLSHLPDYMVPVAFVTLETLPLTTNGKLDRKALPKPDRAAVFTREYEAPQGEIETTLAQIWADVLHIERVGRHDHFFELGGHSLLAMRMVSQVRLQLGVELALSELFVSAELSAVAQVLSRGSRSTLPQILPVARSADLPLSFAQQRLWFLAQMDGANAAYNVPIGLGLRGRLDSEALQRALARIVERHDSLRSRFVQHNDEPHVVITPDSEAFALKVQDLRNQPHAQQRLQALVQQEASEPFDLEQGPLVRGHLLAMADDHHVLLLTMHHIVSDGWSMGVLTRELMALYAAFSSGQADPLPALGIQYSDFAVWQRRWLSGEILQQQTTYWQQALADAPALLMVPTDRPRPAQQDYSGAHVAIQLDTGLTAGLKALSQRHGTTLYMTMMAAWALLLSRLAGQPDVVIGSPVANRNRAEIEGLIGLFVNTLAVRIDTSGGLNVEALLAQVKARTLAAQAHQDLPFEQVVETVRPVRSLSHSPLFQTVLTWVSHDDQPLALGNLQLEGVADTGKVAKFDLTLSLGEVHGEAQSVIAGSLEYATALFDEATMHRYVGYFIRVLQAMVADDQTVLEHLALLDDEERGRLLVAFNASASDYPRGQTIQGLFEAQARRLPDALAVVQGPHSLNYEQLNERANQLAHHLRKLGVQPDDRVAICSRRGPEMLVGLLAILKAGAGYVPVDPAYPLERIAYLLQDSAPVAVLVEASTRDLLGEVPFPVVNLDGGDWQDESIANPSILQLTPAHLAYVIYTSGSTGLPKGVMVEHQTLENLVNWHCDAFDLREGCHTSSVAGFGFDAMAWEVWPALCVGATLHLPPASIGSAHIDELLEWWRAQPLDVSFLPTPVAEYAFSQQLEHPTLRTLLIGGDRLRQFAEAQSFKVINNYGPTEATVVATSGPVEVGQTLHIGKPMANARVYLLDEQQQPVPIGVAGELYVGGSGVARGYLNRPELTTERFLLDPFSPEPQARMYRTGDLARWLADGNIEYLGRNDDQVKIRGVRIELGEIEAALSNHEAVSEAVVLVREDQPGHPQLVAYFTEQVLLEAGELRAHLLSRLPDYMVPVAFVKLESLPLTANGKLDRKALPKPDLAALFTREYQAPQGDTETTLAQIWADVLHVERVGRHDHFFELGGHSLLAMRMVSQVRQRLGVELALNDLFANAELAAVAEVLDQSMVQALARPGRSTLPDIQAAADDQDVPLSFAQQRLWFLAQLEGASTAYNIPVGLRLNGRLDSDALQRALGRIVERHETLRSRFALDDAQGNDEPQVLIEPVERAFTLHRHDLRGQVQAQEALQHWIHTEASAPFDLAHGPLIRGRLIALADDQHALLLTLHHIVADGWSMGVLTRELMALYQAFRLGQRDPLPPLTLQYGDFARWQRRWLSGDILQQQTAYWQQALTGAPALLLLPTDRPRPAQQDYAGASVDIRLDERLTAGLKALSQRHGTTLYMTMMAAWSLLLSRLAGQTDVVIGSPVANRTRAEIEGLIGLFVNTLAIRIDTSAEPTVQALLAQVRDRTLAAQSHQDLPFEQVVEIIRPARSLAHSPLFQTQLVWVNHDDQALLLGDLTLEGIADTSHFAKFDLTLSLGETEGVIMGALEYATALFDESTMRRYVGYFTRVLQAMVADDQAVLGHVDVLGDEERQHLLLDFNATAVDSGLEQTVHGLFEAQVERAPEALAVFHDGQGLSYRQLNERANQLAHYLIAQGVRPDSRVGICVERSPEMVVGLLAILKAGGAYVPIDPAYPHERITYMLQDSAPAAVLVHGATRQLLADARVPVINLDNCTWQDEAVSNPHVATLTPAHLVYVIYTSGSTGQPKGVMVEHHGVANMLGWYLKDVQLEHSDAVLLLTSHSFDLTQKNIFGCLAAGATLHLADTPFDPISIVRQIHEQQITFINLAPSAFYALIDVDETSALSGLRCVVLGGEPIKLAQLQKLTAPRPLFINSYGPTECSDVAGWHRVAADFDVYPSGDVPLGRPIRNLKLYVLDQHGLLAPTGCLGELYIGGEGVARGYLNRDELTAERFLPDPFSTGSQARMYRTGDLARYLPDGTLEYLGRNDDQVKIRGLRIELGEIEARLVAHPDVAEAVVLARNERLLAYFIAATVEGQGPSAEQLRTHLLTQLPDYMVPSAFVRLDAFPLNPNGKLDRKALPTPGLESVIVRQYEAPVGETEITLARLWSELLNVARVGRHDHFFELGGHSLLAVSLIAKMRRAGLSADVRVLFGQPTLSALAAAVGSGGEVEVPANAIAPDCTRITPDMLPLVTLDQHAIDRIVASVPGGAANVQDIYPLAPLQAGILYHHVSARQGDPYLLQAQFAFAGGTRLEAFAQALQSVIERNDILRSAMLWEGLDEPVQVVWRNASLVCEAVELDASDVDALTQLHARFDTGHYRLDITQAPLIRLVHAWDAASQRVVALLLFHHLVMDHVALEILQHEMQACLLDQQKLLGEAVPYRNYVAQTRRGISEQAHEAFFRDMLGDIDEPTLPFGLQEVAGGSSEIDEAQLAVDDALGQRVRAQARQLGVSAASLMHLAWAQVLSQVSGRDEVVFGTVLLGRMQGGEGAERALGVFINTLPLRIGLGSRGVRVAVMQTHERLSRLLEHEHAPLALVQRCSAVAPNTPLFSALLNYRHSAPKAALAEATSAWHGIHLLKAEERTNYLLTLSVDDLHDGFSFTAQTVAGISAQRVCGYMHVALQNLLQALEQTPEAAIQELPILSAEQRHQLLVTFNATERDYPHEQRVERLFEAQVLARPDAIAAVQGGQSVTYAGLNIRANQLAHHLLGLGVKPGDNVAILLERSIDLLVSQLAINKCGAAYVPLDINAPAERKGFMVQDSAAVALLTHTSTAIEYPVRRIDLNADSNTAALSHLPDHNPQLSQSSEAVAYIMYTSGSTGTPKGVLVPHRGITRLVINNGYADFTPDDRVAFASNPAFDASTMDVWGALLNGGQVLVIDHHTLLDPSRFAKALGESGATILFVTTALFNQYVQLIPDALKGLRMLLCGGERADPAAFRRLLAHAPGLRLVHCYGPTETTTYATTHEVKALAADAESVPVGGPISNTRVYVLDARQQPVALGVVGEIYIGGKGVAKGYLNRPELTAETFVPDPFSNQPDALMYRTGDLGRWLGQDQLECIGRTDDQVKIRGFRIEPGEIETRLSLHPALRDAVVLVREDEPGDKRLVAYYTLRPQAARVSIDALRAHLQAQLPDYMVPSAYVQLDALPLTANGKLDRKAFPAPGADTQVGRAYEAPVNELEHTLARLWAEVLKLERVGRHDSFFELGGHSLLAIRLVNLLGEANLHVTLAELFQHASVESVASMLNQRTAAPVRQESLIAVRTTGTQSPLFLVHEFSGLDVYFPALGKHIDGDFPIYGLPGIALGQAQLQTMECLAARLVDIIRSVQAQGPYRLAGWSFGGVLAYEVAQQLLGLDEQVEFLGLIDSYVPRMTDQGKARWSGSRAQKLHLLLQCKAYWTAQGNAGVDALARLERLDRDIDRVDFEALLQQCREQELLYSQLAAASSAELGHFLGREVAHGHALAHYSLHPIPMPVHLFSAEQRPTELSRLSESLGWAEVLPASRLRRIDVPGDHLSMMQAPHVQVLGQALSQAISQPFAAPDAVHHQPVLTIQSGRSGHAPVFCVPGAGDSVTGFIGLTEALGPDWPILGLQPRGLDGEAVPHGRVETAAAHYLQALTRVHPEGAVHLIGHSFGGWVAFEMAARLQAQGREVASLTLIDSEAPGGNGVVGKPYTATAALQRLLESMQLAAGKPLGVDPEQFVAEDDISQLRMLHAGMVRAGLLSPRAAADSMSGPARTFSTALRTVYQPQHRYGGLVRLVLAQDPTLDAAGNQREQEAMISGWRKHVGELGIWYGPGNHFTILKAPNVYSLAAWWHDGLSLQIGEVIS